MDDDIVMCFCLLYPDILSTDAIRTDEYVDFLAYLSEIECLGDGSIPCAHDSDREALVEVAITGCTI